jgi:hypothetical protein
VFWQRKFNLYSDRNKQKANIFSQKNISTITVDPKREPKFFQGEAFRIWFMLRVADGIYVLVPVLRKMTVTESNREVNDFQLNI